VSDCPFIVPAVLDDAGLDVYAFRVLGHAARRAGKDGTYYGSGKRSACLCRMSLRRLRSALGRLVTLGLLEIAETTPGKPTVYRLRLDRCTTCTSAPDTPVHDVPGTGAPRAQGSAPRAQVPVHHVHTKETRKGIPSRSPEKVPPISPDGEALLVPVEASTSTATDALIEQTPTTTTQTVDFVEAVLLTEIITPKRSRTSKSNGNGNHAHGWAAEAAELMEAVTGGVVKPGKIGGILGPLVSRHGWETIRPVWEAFLASPKRQYGAAYFAEHPRDFANGGVRQMDQSTEDVLDDIGGLFQ
jgi:hypothetical protein